MNSDKSNDKSLNIHIDEIFKSSFDINSGTDTHYHREQSNYNNLQEIINQDILPNLAIKTK